MQLNEAKIRQYFKEFKFAQLFNELGWEHHSVQLKVTVDGETFLLDSVAEKRGFAVFACSPSSGGGIPQRPHRLRIDSQVTKSAREHLIIFTDANKTTQIWQWVKREQGKPSSCRENSYDISQSGEALIQKLRGLLFTLEQEEQITLPHVYGRARDAFDVERVTKRFYDRFKAEHERFLKFIEGIPEEDLQRWYASVMLNRLMFIYFIQRKNFLNDANYLKTKLQESKQQGKNLFYSKFVCTLFFEGFAKKESERSREVNQLLGKIPYLNGGLFLRHQIEELHGKTIQISNSAFEKLFDFFDEYQWHLDERPLALRKDKEINPDVLGYIFEKYINQKQMGAYYTKEDITGYISRNTIIPRLFDIAKQKCKIAFEGEQSVWRLLQADPDRYIYDAVKHGITMNARATPPTPLEKPYPLPPEIGIGIKDVSKRTEWNKAAPDAVALPTEIWREVVARRQRYEEVHKKLSNGEIGDINDLITYNLNIQQFAQDVIENCEGSELLRAFWHAIEKITILDPTCGSGAFLFAALNILESLYEACLNRMQAFVDELERSGEKHRPEKFSIFKKVLDQMKQHPNEKYFIFKSITVNNLYGVDIMEEAVEICKLRLFLKLVAQVDRVEEIEPLPDIDFNIRAGNTLVGFVKLEEVKSAAEIQATYDKRTAAGKGQGKFLLDDSLKRIEENAELADRAFQLFHKMQTDQEMDAKDFAKAKEEVRTRLDKLAEELNRYLASEYGIHRSAFSDKSKYEEKFVCWLTSHKPFHWFTEFFGIMHQGGFDVIIGNPPYVEYSKVRDLYEIRELVTESCGNLYAMCSERSLKLLRRKGRFGFIVQSPVVSTPRMAPLRDWIHASCRLTIYATFDDRPSKLFSGMHHCRVAIILSCIHDDEKSHCNELYTTRYHKWYDVERAVLFQVLSYQNVPQQLCSDLVPKLGGKTEILLYQKLIAFPHHIGGLMTQSATEYRIYYKITGVGHWFTFTLRPPRFWRDGIVAASTRENTAFFDSREKRDAAYCCLNSTLHYWLYQMRTNCRDYNPSDLKFFPVPKNLIEKANHESLAIEIANKLDESSETGEGNYEIGGHVRFEKFRPKLAKPTFDKVDKMIGDLCGLSDEELDFIINYDIKYRMGQDSASEEEE